MVRLKDLNPTDNTTKLHSFNSNMVRLKDVKSHSEPERDLSFNSNMVRLKVQQITKKI